MSHCLKIGSVFAGTVTQSGIMIEGQYHYHALQTCTLIIKSLAQGATTCEIRRVESKKFINGQPIPLHNWPEYLQQYLTTWGSAVESAVGTYCPRTGVLLLRGEEPVVAVKSSVQWSPHVYALLVDDGVIKGLAFDLGEGADYVSETGVMMLRKDRIL